MFYIGIIWLVALDLITKYLAKINLQETKNLVGDFLYLRYTENIGIAFSIPVTGLFLKILTIAIICVLFWYYFTEEKKKQNTLINLSFCLIFAWAFWNGYERVFNGTVIDFIGVQYFSVFNLADVFITIWVILYISTFIFLNKPNNA